MTTPKTLFSALLVIGLSAGLIAQMALANDRFADHHPRRAEVLGRDRNMGKELRGDRGDLGGHYKNLMAQDHRIRRQEQRDARQNGGHITKQEQNQLNREENRLNHRIHRDDRDH